MRAVAIQAHGGLDQVKLRTDWPEPTAGPGQAVVTVKACGLNYLDIFVLQGMPGLPVTMPRIPGGDISGVVHSVGGIAHGGGHNPASISSAAGPVDIRVVPVRPGGPRAGKLADRRWIP